MGFIPQIIHYWVLASNEKLRDIAIHEFVPKFFITSGLPLFKYLYRLKPSVAVSQYDSVQYYENPLQDLP
jgi:hypothetical protein